MHFNVAVDPVSRDDLLVRLAQASVGLNKYTRKLLSTPVLDEPVAGEYSVCVLSIAELGLGSDEATLPAIYKRARELGYELCPLELAFFFRLEWFDQPESSNSVLSDQKQALDSSVTVATPVLSEDIRVPKGFYLRVVDGVPWLRGHTCDDAYTFEPNAMFAFVR